MTGGGNTAREFIILPKATRRKLKNSSPLCKKNIPNRLQLKFNR